MRAEIRVYGQSRYRRGERKLVDWFSIISPSGKRFTRGRVKKLLRTHFIKQAGRYGFFHVSRSPDGVFHAMYSGRRMIQPCRYVWYYVELEPLTQGDSNVGNLLQQAVIGDDG